MLKNKISIGTVQFGADYGISNDKGKTSDLELKRILTFCRENNIFSFDTAESYGSSEKRIGNFFKNNPNFSWNVTTKVLDRHSILNQFEKSINNLGLVPNTILAHRAEDYLNNNFRKSLISLQNNYNKLKIGVSVYSEEEIFRIIDTMIPDVIQLPINILDTRIFRSGTLDILNNYKINIQARSIFLQGLFYLPMHIIESKFFDAVPPIKKIKAILSNTGISIAELSLFWVASLSQISKVIIGVNNLKQLKFHLKFLSKKVDKNIIDEALKICYVNEEILNPSLWKKK